MTVNTYKHSHTLTETLVYIVYTLSVNCKYKAFRQRQKKYIIDTKILMISVRNRFLNRN